MQVSSRAQELFLEAHALDPNTRSQFVTDACSGNRSLLEEVNSLLTAANASDGCFERLSGRVGLSALPEEPPLMPAHKTLGAWRLQRLIGQGGMGSVYLANRADGQFEQLAALKILPVGLAHAQARARFLLERQILARLVHDNIARLLDGGISDDGVPYFVMDYVEGAAIDVYCERKRLGVADRLRLVLNVADAVQYAHRNLVVHRDLKPSNVLVQEDGRVRLVDFGIATLLEPGTGQANLTQQTHRPATPGFASPEMLRGDVVDVTTDVYSIGALLYVLLTNKLPLSYGGLSLAAMLDHAATAVAPPASHHNPTLDPDIDAIVAKALAKQPGERYASVESLATDIRNWLDGIPVTAKPPSPLHLARKFVSRHRLGVSFAAFAILALAGLTGIATYSAINTERKALGIALQRDQAEQTTEFLVSIFDSANPGRTAADLTAREILNTARQRIGVELADQPELKVELLKTMSNVYWKISLTDELRETLETERELRAELNGVDDSEYADFLIRWSRLEDMAGNYDRAQQYAQEALAISQRHGDRIAEAEGHRRIGRMLHLKGDYESADAGYRKSLEIYRDELGSDSLEADSVRYNLATLLNHMQEYEQSLGLLEQVLETRRQHYPEDHGEFSEVFTAMGSVLNGLGRHDEATEIYERAFAMNERLFGPDNANNYFVVNGLGKVAELKGDYATAAIHYKEAVRLNVMQFDDHPNLGISKANLGNAYMFSGRFDLAVPAYREAVDIIGRHLPEHWMLGDMRWRLGHCIVKSGGDYAEAEPLILEGIDTLTAQWGKDHPRTRAAIDAAAELYQAWDRPE